MASPAQSYQRTPEPGNPARTEAWALLEAARKLSHTKNGPADQFLAALRLNWRLWTIFQSSLLEPDCTMPADIRGNLLGLANFVDRQTAILLTKPDPAGIQALVNINIQIGEGLLAGSRTVVPQKPAPTLTAGLMRQTA
jgi:flagellar protein FlaF